MFNALSAVKLGVSAVVGLGTGKIAGAIIKNNVNPETLIDKVTITAASWVIGAMATKATKNATGEMIDETYEGVTSLVHTFKVKAKLDRISAGTSTFEAEGLDESEFVRNEKTRKWESKVAPTDAL